MKKQLLEEFNLRLAAVENEITTLQNQITNLSQPTCTDSDLAQMKMLISKFPLSNLKNAQYLHATQLQVANLFEQLEHEKNLRRQQDRTIQQLQIVVENLQKKITPTVEQPANTSLPTPSSTEPESTDIQRRLAEMKPHMTSCSSANHSSDSILLVDEAVKFSIKADQFFTSQSSFFDKILN